MKTTNSSLHRNRYFRRGSSLLASALLATGPAFAVDNQLNWYGSGSGGAPGGSGEWAAAATGTNWYDGTNYLTWAGAVATYGTSATNLIVANFGGTAGTVTVGNLGSNNVTYIGTVKVTTGGYNFDGTGSIGLAAPDRTHLIVDTVDNTPVSFGAGITFALRSSVRTIEVGDGDTLNVAGAFDNGRINKTGAGTLRLTGQSVNISNVNGFTVTGGKLLVNTQEGSGTGNSGISVLSGATLGGTGIIGTSGTGTRSVTIGGTLSPGDNSASELTFDFSNPNSRLVFQDGSFLDLTLGAESDIVSFLQTGDWLSGAGLVTINLTFGEGFSYGASYTVFENVSTVDFTALAITGYDQSQYLANLSLVDDDYVLTFSAVPEPSTFALLGAGVALVAWRVGRRMLEL